MHTKARLIDEFSQIFTKGRHLGNKVVFWFFAPFLYCPHVFCPPFHPPRFLSFSPLPHPAPCTHCSREPATKFYSSSLSVLSSLFSTSPHTCSLLLLVLHSLILFHSPAQMALLSHPPNHNSFLLTNLGLPSYSTMFTCFGGI